MIGVTYVPCNMAVWCPQCVTGPGQLTVALQHKHQLSNKKIKTGNTVYTDLHIFCPKCWFIKTVVTIGSSAYAPFSRGKSILAYFIMGHKIDPQQSY